LRSTPNSFPTRETDLLILESRLKDSGTCCRLLWLLSRPLLEEFLHVFNKTIIMSIEAEWHKERKISGEDIFL